MADAIVINKADHGNEKNAKIAQIEFNRALHLYPLKDSKWQPKVLTASAIASIGIDAIDEMIQEYLSLTKKNGYFQQKRHEQNTFWLLSTIEEQLKERFYQNPSIKKALSEEIKQLANGKTTPFLAAKRLLGEES
jgi:LAO/AO transport system kinase